MTYQLIDAQGEIDRLRPTKCDPKYSYLTRLRPDIKTKNWSLRGTGIKLNRGENWVAVSGRIGNILLQITEKGYSWADARFRRGGRTLRPLVDMARNKAEAERVEQLYEIDKRQRMPGTAERPHDMAYRTGTPDAERGLQEVERLFHIVDNSSPFDERPQFAPSPESHDQEVQEAPAIPELNNPEPVDTDAGMSEVEGLLGIAPEKAAAKKDSKPTPPTSGSNKSKRPKSKADSKSDKSEEKSD